MTYDRSLDDLPLAAYGGSGMELTPEDSARIEAAAPPEAVEPAPPESADAVDAVAPGPFAHAVSSPDLPDDNFGAGPPSAPRSLPPVVGKVATTLRTSRLAAGATVAGVIVVGLLLLSGGKPGLAGAAASASPPPIFYATAAPATGDATVEISGKHKGAYTLTGATGTGPATGGSIGATWSDTTGSSLSLSGNAAGGTRTTDPTFVLTLTVLVNGAPMAFSSTEGECTVGMAVQVRSVSGSFICKKLKSDDGKVTVDVRGTYRT